MVEGVFYFDIDRDSEMRKEIKKERNELIGQMLKAKNNGVETQPIAKEEKQRVHCDLLEEVK